MAVVVLGFMTWGVGRNLHQSRGLLDALVCTHVSFNGAAGINIGGPNHGCLVSVHTHSEHIDFQKERQTRGVKDRDSEPKPRASSNLLRQTPYFPRGMVLVPFLLGKFVGWWL